MESSNYPMVGFYFSVSLPGEDENIGFQEISGISAQITTEEVASGGENRFIYRLPMATASPNLILKRGMAPANSVFMQWCTDIIGSAFANTIKPKTVIVNLLTENGKPTMAWKFYNAYPVTYKISDLHSQKNELVIEMIELAYNYMESVSLSNS